MYNSTQQNSLKQMWQAYQSAQNQQEFINNMMSQNPMLKTLIGSGDPKQIFFDMCKQRNIDPDTILSQLK